MSPITQMPSPCLNSAIEVYQGLSLGWVARGGLGGAVRAFCTRVAGLYRYDALIDLQPIRRAYIHRD